MTTHYDEDPATTGHLDIQLWRRMLRHARPHAWSLGGLAASGFVVAICDVVFPWLTGTIIDDSITNGGENLRAYGGGYIALVAILATTVSIFIVLAGRAATGIAHDLRRDGFARFQELSFSYYDTRPVGSLIARLTTDCDRIASILPWALLDFVWGLLLLSGVASMMLWMNWKLALVVLGIIPPLAWVTANYQAKALRSQRFARKVNTRITAAFNEGISAVRTTKAFVLEDENLREFKDITDALFRHSMQNALYAAVFLPIVITLGAAGVGLTLWRGGLLTRTGFGAGELVAFMQYAALFHIPIQEMAERFTGLQAAQASAERLQALLDTRPDVRDRPDVSERPDVIGEVAFEGVDFRYDKGQSVLQNFNLRIRAGECVALVGETGSGKSTVAKLLCRFYEPVSGRLAIDGVDYRDRSQHWLQSRLGIVLQEPHLFSGTIYDNIRYGRLDATDSEIREVARQVGAADFIECTPGGYATEVGEGGNQLSTGQKQLIALARAMIANPQIVILDEATSSIDTETERQIQSGIEAVLRGRISMIIAHRLSTVRSASRIVVLDRGKIVEEGSHMELLRRQGSYARFYGQQFRKEAGWRAVETASS